MSASTHELVARLRDMAFMSPESGDYEGVDPRVVTALRGVADLINEAANALDALSATSSAAAARIARLEEALRPFVKAAGVFEPHDWSGAEYSWTDDYEPFDMHETGDRVVGLTVGDLRRARAALGSDAE